MLKIIGILVLAYWIYCANRNINILRASITQRHADEICCNILINSFIASKRISVLLPQVLGSVISIVIVYWTIITFEVVTKLQAVAIAATMQIIYEALLYYFGIRLLKTLPLLEKIRLSLLLKIHKKV